jgi:hypothetical protein
VIKELILTVTETDDNTYIGLKSEGFSRLEILGILAHKICEVSKSLSDDNSPGEKRTDAEQEAQNG